MTRGRYSISDPDLVRELIELKDRVSKLERTPQLPNSNIGSGGISVTGPTSQLSPGVIGQSSYKVVAGTTIPALVRNFYTFFGRTAFVGVIWTRGGPNDYAYEVLTCRNAGSDNNFFRSAGVVTNGVCNHLTDYTSFNDGFGNSLTGVWFGLVGTLDVTIGSNIFTGSRLLLQEAGIVIDGLPDTRIWMASNNFTAEATADLTLTTTPTDITGAGITGFLIPRASRAEVTGVFDFEETVAGTTVAVGDLVVDGGAVQARKARFGVAAVTDRGTVAQKWDITFATGNDLVPHTFQLQGSKTIAAGTVIARQISTNITAKVYCQ